MTLPQQDQHVSSSGLGNTISSAYHEYIEEPLHSLEDKAKWAVHHTREELSKSPKEWQEERIPKTEVEKKYARGEIPLSTEELLLGAEKDDVVGGGDDSDVHDTGGSGYEEFKKSIEEGIKNLDVREPGSEGEVSS